MPARLLLAACITLLFPISLTAQAISRYDIVIDELFPDPSPSVLLPASEFIELKNISGKAINLRNCNLSDGNTSAIINIDFVLQPDSFVIICPNAALSEYSKYGPSIGLSNFPSLNNDADVIALYAANGTMIHAVSYNSSWYQNAVKSNGGYTLEMIDPRNPCAGLHNWQASNDNAGGTPGKQNSIDKPNPDSQPPALLRTYTIDSLTIVAVFDEPLDSVTAALPSNYQLDQHQPTSAQPIMPASTEVILKFPSPLASNTTYQLSTNSISDCSGNTIGQMNTAKAGLPQIPENAAIVINELLFNPPSDGYDYIELYNRSNAIVDLKQLFVTNKNSTTTTPIASIPYLLFPGEYKAITTNKQWLQQQYLVNNNEAIIECPALPSMPDDKGDIIVLNQQGVPIDALHYEEKWHFALIDSKEGVALERINYNAPTQNKSNWSSAASTTRFGTPGYPNSQLQPAIQAEDFMTITPPVFSPDNDGRDDYATIQLQLPEPGYVANIFIFDAQGHRVRYLVQQATLSVSNLFRWDGLNDNNSRLPPGNYILFSEVFNLNGQTKKLKRVITIVRR